MVLCRHRVGPPFPPHPASLGAGNDPRSTSTTFACQHQIGCAHVLVFYVNMNRERLGYRTTDLVVSTSDNIGGTLQ